MRLLAVDPGVRGVGAAVFFKGVLQTATYVKGPLMGRRLRDAVGLAQAVSVAMGPVDQLVIEVPRSYGAAHQKGPQDDLIDVALVAACVAGRFDTHEDVVTYYPAEWKGSVKAEHFLARILERLTPTEKAVIRLVGRVPLEQVPESDSLDHNTLDAIGIGLKFLGRLERARVYARE